jgi:type IV pilus assembly protein PilX
MNYPKQRGSTLIISLIILVLLMLLGVTAMNSSDTGFKLTGNLQFDNNALNVAESVLSSVENDIKTGTINYNDAKFFAASSVTADTSGLYPLGAAIDPLTITWDDAHTKVAGTGRRIIQLLSTNNVLIGSSLTVGGPLSYACNRVNTYSITALGTGGRGAAKTVQSYYSVVTTC